MKDKTVINYYYIIYIYCSLTHCINFDAKLENDADREKLQEAVLDKFLNFVDSSSSRMDARRAVSHGATYYFTPKFFLMQTPNLDDPQYEYKCKHSVLYEFNRTLEEEALGKISVGTFHSWLKQPRPYVGISPS